LSADTTVGPCTQEQRVEFSIKSGSPEKQRCGCVVVGVFEQRQLSLAAELLDKMP
jgi:leucyl aminopeptidase